MKAINHLHKMQAIMAVLSCGFPGRKIKVIAVAGTKGKTTTTNMIAKVLEAGGYKVAMLSTANFQIGERKWLNDVKLTTPSPFYLQSFLKKAVKEKCDYAVVEVSSHGLVQYRHYGIKYRTVVLTNMMSDHLDYHKTYDNYKKSHDALITKHLKNLIINYDDDDLRSYLSQANATKYACSLKGYDTILNANPVTAEHISFKKGGTDFVISFAGTKSAIAVSLIGEFNIYNALLAFSAGLAEGIMLDDIKNGLQAVKEVPGRLEKIDEGQDFEVIVDYAHSPDSLRSVYSAVKPYVRNRLIAVLGGTGDRDKSYREKAGNLADRYANIVIVTNEDPYSEDPENIMDQVLSGITQKKMGHNLFRIYDRQEAIAKAIKMAVIGDTVLITGKGSEQFMVVKDKKIPWDDRAIAREALKDRLKQ